MNQDHVKAKAARCDIEEESRDAAGPTRFPRRPNDAMQFPTSAGADILDAVIGLDFGTTCTKVFIRTPFHDEGRTLGVPFDGQAHQSCRYLLPTRLTSGPDKALYLGDASGGKKWRNLKMRLREAASALAEEEIASDSTLQSVALVAGYLALTLRQSRLWFLQTQRDEVGRFRLRWHLNIGIPSIDCEDEPLVHATLAAALAAWKLSKIDNPLSLREAIATAEAALSSTPENDGLLHAIPEVVAEVAGYARSDWRDPGLHLLVDMGGSTLDICAFILWQTKDLEDQYSFLSTRVESLGVLEIHSRRVHLIQEVKPGLCLFPDPPEDPLLPIKEDSSDYLKINDEQLIIALESLDEVFERECADGLTSVIMACKINRDPNSDRWEKGLPVFVCGGGRDLSHLSNALWEAEKRLTASTSAHGLERFSLPKPSDVGNEDIDKETFQRLAVAYGLSFPRFDIGGVELPDEIPDVSPPINRDWEKDFPSKDYD